MVAEMRKISIKDMHVSFKVKNGKHDVLKGVNLEVASNESVGVLGRNGAGKSTLINIINGTLNPRCGTVDFGGMLVSWPVGRPTFQGSLTAVNNIRFICRAFGKPIQEVIDFVDDFSELGKYMHMPVKTYSSGMRARLGFAISMAMDFDCLLVDEGFNAGDARFTQKMNDLFIQKKANTNMICVSHNPNIIRKFCDRAVVLANGKINEYADMEEAISVYKTL